MIALPAATTALGLVLIFIGFAWRSRPAPEVRQSEERMRFYAVRASVDADDLQGSIFDRILRPQVDRLRTAADRFTPSGHYRKLRWSLAAAGQPLGLEPTDFVVLRGCVTFVFLALAGTAGYLIGGLPVAAGVGIPSALLGWAAPGFWLRGKVRQRQTKIRNALPDVIDFLVVMLNAGLGFGTALSRVADKFHNALTEEVAKSLAEVELGRGRDEALRALAERVGVDEVSVFVNTAVNSSQFGVPIVDSLRVVADDLRWRRRERARTQGALAPIKMTLPMVLLILPTIWFILLAPSLFQIVLRGI